MGAMCSPSAWTSYPPETLARICELPGVLLAVDPLRVRRWLSYEPVPAPAMAFTNHGPCSHDASSPTSTPCRSERLPSSKRVSLDCTWNNPPTDHSGLKR